MSDENTNPDEEPDHIKQLRADAKRGRDADAKAQEQDREIAFLRAGVDTESKVGKMLFKTYEGELNTDAIKAEAIDLGLLKAEEPPPDDTPAPGSPESQYADTSSQMRHGDPAAQDDTPTNAIDGAFKEFHESQKRGARRSDAVADGFAHVISQAIAGNPSAIFDEAKWEQEASRAGHGTTPRG